MGCQNGVDCQNEASEGLILILLISYYWTYQVVKNHLHVTVAGTIGTWWFDPHSNVSKGGCCCAAAITDSFQRASTYSFGSICLGSLIVAIIQAAKDALHMARENGDDACLCCAECLLGCIENIAEYFNKWAFVFVGLYGYGFMEAGKNVLSLFTQRGWTVIITDNLVDGVLMMMSMAIGIWGGIFGLLVVFTKGMDLYPVVAFCIGFFVGFVLSSVVMGVIGSAVNTVIVCYAEAPKEFQNNHPELSDQMRAAWRQAWPNDFKY